VCCCVDYHGPRTRARSMTIDRSLFLFSILGRAYCCVDRFVGLGFGVWWVGKLEVLLQVVD
jgi:hypothetical protein